jgi:hypothetical protein
MKFSPQVWIGSGYTDMLDLPAGRVESKYFTHSIFAKFFQWISQKIKVENLCENSFITPNPYKKSISCRAGASSAKYSRGRLFYMIFVEVAGSKFPVQSLKIMKDTPLAP